MTASVGDAVYHRNLQMVGVVIEPVGLGVASDTRLVDFGNDDVREVTEALLTPLTAHGDGSRVALCVVCNGKSHGCLDCGGRGTFLYVPEAE